MHDFRRILVIQTAFIGDAALTLPLIQVLKREFPSADLNLVAVPRSADLFRNHPDITRIIEYDKRGKQKGVGGFLRIAAMLKTSRYDAAFVPHRSLRSALLATMANIPFRVGFDKSAGWFFFSKTVKYKSNAHEIERNLSLLEAIGKNFKGRELPNLYPSFQDRQNVDRFLESASVSKLERLVAIAPGTIWNTKRWLKEKFTEVAEKVINSECIVVLVGGREDQKLCEEIEAVVGPKKLVNAAGKLSLLESAELLRRCQVLISNDSAPMHIAVAMRTPVVAIFGATVPAFGFAPYGEHDVVVETLGLSCRPCSIHGGAKCPIGTFDCMNRITANQVYDSVAKLSKNFAS